MSVYLRKKGWMLLKIHPFSGYTSWSSYEACTLKLSVLMNLAQQ